MNTPLPPPPGASALPPPPPRNDSPPPGAGAPPYAAAEGDAPDGRPAIGLGAAAGIGVLVAVVAGALWFALDDLLRDAEPDTGVVWVPAVALALAGGLWGVVSRGPGRPVRAALGAVVGAAAGVAGALLLGRAQLHLDALSDDVTLHPVQALIWALFGAVAWGLTLGAASVPTDRRRVAIGAASGGALAGVAMGALVGRFFHGTPPSVTPTDFWWSLPLRASDVGVRVVPVLLVGLVVPLLFAAPARPRGSTVALRVATAVAVIAAAGGVRVGNGHRHPRGGHRHAGSE